MSKSDPADSLRINILDSPDTIRDKIKRCKTDSVPGGIASWDEPNRPEATNLLNIYAIMSKVRGMRHIYVMY
jgi:tryptophanyl-tRNA synthetase